MEKRKININSPLKLGAYQTILVEPTLVIPWDALAIDGSFISTYLYSMQGYSSDNISIRPDLLANALTAYVIKMVANSATKILVPSHSQDSLLCPANVKSMLSESTAHHIKYVDRRQGLWTTIKQYLQPVRKDLHDLHGSIGRTHGAHAYLDIIGWDLYCLSIATKYSCDAFILPQITIEALDYINHNASLSSQNKLRVARLRGIFQLYETKDEVPGLRFLPTVSRHHIRDRIDEILEDAYLLEASYFRTFFSISSNRAAVKRNLRRLMKAIVRHRRWAKGIVDTASHLAFLPPDRDKLSEILMSFLDLATIKTVFAPVLLHPDDPLYGAADPRQACIIRAYRCISSPDPHSWSVRLQ